MTLEEIDVFHEALAEHLRKSISTLDITKLRLKKVMLPAVQVDINGKVKTKTFSKRNLNRGDRIKIKWFLFFSSRFTP